MSRVFVISDTHFCSPGVIHVPGRKGIFNSHEEMDEIFLQNWNKVVTKRDVVYHLGDVGYDRSERFSKGIYPFLSGRKYVVGGNHDTAEILACFDKVFGAVPYTHKGIRLMLTHIPMHTQEVYPWYEFNLHGHLHLPVVLGPQGPDLRYINCCVEHTNFAPRLLADIVDERVEMMERLGEWPLTLNRRRHVELSTKPSV